MNELPPICYAEWDAVKKAAGDCRGMVALDAGCRWRQMTEPLKPAAKIVALDHHQLARGVMSQQLPAGYFDIAISSQVLPHLPTPELRRRFVHELARTLKPSGRLVISTMHYNLRFPKFGIPKEGISEGAFYHRYTVEEFQSELARHFQIDALWGIWTYLPKTYRLFTALGKYNIYWDRLLRERRISLKYGKFLLAICSPLPTKK